MSKKQIDNIEELIKALEAGGYNAAPLDLSGGPVGIVPADWKEETGHKFLMSDIETCVKCGKKIPIDETFSPCPAKFKSKQCECGVSKTGGIHSDWCPIT